MKVYWNWWWWQCTWLHALHSYTVIVATQSAWVREVGPTGKCFGYGLCGDNINKIIKTHYIRLDMQNVLLHYLHYQYLIMGLQFGPFQCPAQCRLGNFPLSQKLLDLEGFGTLPPELLLLSGHRSVPNTLTSPST